MENARVGAGAHNASVSRALGAATSERIDQQGLDLVLVHARPGASHRELMSFSRDARRGPHRFDFARRLAKAHLVQDDARVDELRRGDDPQSLARADAIDGREEALVEAPVRSKAMVDAAAVLEEGGQLFVDFRDGEGLVGTVDLPGTVHPGAVAVPDLPLAIA
jgi:hypothetical protein